MFRRNAVVLMAISLLLVGAAAASATTYTLNVMGTFSGQSTNLPRDYLAASQNANGGDTVVGILASPNNTNYWEGLNAQESSFTQLNVIKPNNYGSNVFHSISANGALAGGTADGAVDYPFVISIPEGTTTAGTILTSLVGSPAQIVGVNNAGDMAVNTTTNNYLLPSGTTYTVGTLPGNGAGTWTPLCMSNNGIIGGTANPGAPAEWTPIVTGGVITGYNSPTVLATSVGNNGSVYGVNTAGEACGQYDFLGTGQVAEPGLYVGNKAIAMFPGYDYVSSSNPTSGCALGINDNGTVVGYDNWDGGPAGAPIITSHGFIWVPTAANGTTSTSGAQDMNTVFASALTGAYAGDVIVAGLGINDNGDVLVMLQAGSTTEVALISTPWAAVPEPSTLLLAASGLIGLLAYAWRKRK